MSFELRGRDEDGVVHFTGLDRGPALFEWLVVLALGVLFVSAIVVGAVAAAMRGHAAATIGAMPFMMGVGWLAVGGALWWLRVRRRMSGLESLSELSERTGVGEDDLAQAAKRTDIRPVYRVNRVELYDPAQFDAAMLLRPGPESTELLQASRGSVDLDTLPRAAE